MTQYGMCLIVKNGNQNITQSKRIMDFCPSDLLRFGVDDCDGDKEDEKCKECWSKEYVQGVDK